MKYQGKSMMSLNEMAKLAIDYEGDGYITGYPIVSGDDAYILNGVIEANEEYITINQWVPVFPESLTPVSPSLSDDQREVLESLKHYYSKSNYYDIRAGKEPMQAVDRMLMEAESDATRLSDVYYRLTEKQQFQVLAAFAEWGLSTLDN